jgi:hypothetical protein
MEALGRSLRRLAQRPDRYWVGMLGRRRQQSADDSFAMAKEESKEAELAHSCLVHSERRWRLRGDASFHRIPTLSPSTRYRRMRLK